VKKEATSIIIMQDHAAFVQKDLQGYLDTKVLHFLTSDFL
jgi:hypothetical protein